MNRHRKGSVKMEHHIIPGLREVLEEIGHWPEVQTVVPGRIKHTGKGSTMWLRVQDQTVSGLKILAHNGGAVQEVFVVTGSPETVTARITERYGRK